MKTSNTVLLLFVISLLGVVSCTDKIVTQSVPQSAASALIIYNKIDLSVQPDKLQSQIVVVDSTGANPQNWAIGFVSAAAHGKVAYTTGVTGQHFEVIVSKNDNSQKHTIYSSTDPNINLVLFPILSHDGVKVAFATAKKDSSNANLYVANYDGSGLSLISDRMNAQTIPSFRSDDDGTIMFYQIDNDRVIGLDSVARDSTGNIITIPDTTGSPFPGASGFTITTTDGSNNSFGSGGEGNLDPGIGGAGRISYRHGIQMFAYLDHGKIFTDLQTDSDHVKLIDNGSAPLWSPDGTQLAYNGTDNHIYTTWDLGTTKTDLTGSNQQSAAISEWSPNSGKILCASWTGTLGKSAASLKQVDVNTIQTVTIASPAFYGYYLK